MGEREIWEEFRTSPLPLETPESPEPQPQEEAPRGVGCGRVLWEVIQTLLMALGLYLLLNLATARVVVRGLSMYPTFKGNEFVLVNRLAYRLGEPQRGDVVVFHPNFLSRDDYIKRIIGLPGDEIIIRGGKVYVNGQVLHEPYIAEPPHYTGRWVVPEGHIFVLGDNRNHSQDSHVFGPVPLDAVVGKAEFVYWPPTAWGKIQQPDVFASVSDARSTR